MVLWKNGQLNELVLEGRAIQNRLPTQDSKSSKEDISRKFAKLMFAGKTKQALDLLSNGIKGGILNLDSPSNPNDQSSPTVKDILLSKHPNNQPVYPDCILSSDPDPPHPIIFDSIDGNAIRSAALNIHGSSGPSGLDAYAWRRLCTSFKGASIDLCNSLAGVAKRLCTTYVDSKSVSSFLACCLIALDKCPGVRPIGIGDTARRIVAKAVLYVVKPDIQHASGCLQMCGGQVSGIEAAVHAIRSAFDHEDCEAILLADASNAFNSLNRLTALHNIQRLCPPLATILINTYRSSSDLFVDGKVLLSQEGTTQGDPLAMPMYALATIPLINQLKGDNTQVWYADDAAAAGNLSCLRDWWDKLSLLGPKFGYYPNASKSWLITKESFLSDANTIFAHTGVNITSRGRPYLGAAIGTREFVASHINSKVEEWISSIQHLALIAKSQPHAAFSALTHGLSSKWTYISRTTPNISDLLLPLDNAIRSLLLPELTGQPPPSDLLTRLFALPARLGIKIPSMASEREYQSSLQATSALSNNILLQTDKYTEDTLTAQLHAKSSIRSNNSSHNSNTAKSICSLIPEYLKKAVSLAQEQGASTWLTVLPLEEHGFSLHKGAFRDALALRFGWSLTNIPSHCACGNKLTTEHTFSCAKGGFPSMRSETSLLLFLPRSVITSPSSLTYNLSPVKHFILPQRSLMTVLASTLLLMASGVVLPNELSLM